MQQTYQPPLEIFPERVSYINQGYSSREEDSDPFMIGMPAQQIESYDDPSLRRLLYRQLYQRRSLAHMITLPVVSTEGRLSYSVTVPTRPIEFPRSSHATRSIGEEVDIPFEIFETQEPSTLPRTKWLGNLIHKLLR